MPLGQRRGPWPCAAPWRDRLTERAFLINCVPINSCNANEPLASVAAPQHLLSLTGACRWLTHEHCLSCVLHTGMDCAIPSLYPHALSPLRKTLPLTSVVARQPPRSAHVGARRHQAAPSAHHRLAHDATHTESYFAHDVRETRPPPLHVFRVHASPDTRSATCDQARSQTSNWPGAGRRPLTLWARALALSRSVRA